MSTCKHVTIVLLPGMDGTGELLAPLAARLSAMRPVQLISYPMDASWGYDKLISFVLAKIPDTRFVILGESFSGPIAIDVAAQEDDRVAGLILASSFVRHPLPRLFRGIVPLLKFRSVSGRLIDALLLGPGARRDLVDALHGVQSRSPPRVMARRIAEVLRVDRRGPLRKTRCPLLCIHGRRDPVVRKSNTTEIQSIRPDAEVYLLDGWHLILETHADEAADAINRFCERVS